MKTLEAEEGKSLELTPCLNCVAIEHRGSGGSFARLKNCPCPNHSGEIEWNNDNIIRFSCESRQMHQLPKSKIKREFHTAC